MKTVLPLLLLALIAVPVAGAAGPPPLRSARTAAASGV
jgi:hypothetical protein